MKTNELIGQRLKNKFNQIHPFFCPVGSVVAWQKNMFSVAPALPSSWAECNGQVVSDVESPFNGMTLPALNSGARILKGGVIAGILSTVGIKTGTGYNMTTATTVWIMRIK